MTSNFHWIGVCPAMSVEGTMFSNKSSSGFSSSNYIYNVIYLYILANSIKWNHILVVKIFYSSSKQNVFLNNYMNNAKNILLKSEQNKSLSPNSHQRNIEITIEL